MLLRLFWTMLMLLPKLLGIHVVALHMGMVPGTPPRDMDRPRGGG